MTNQEMEEILDPPIHDEDRLIAIAADFEEQLHQGLTPDEASSIPPGLDPSDAHLLRRVQQLLVTFAQVREETSQVFPRHQPNDDPSSHAAEMRQYFQIPERLGRFHIVRELGRGGCGVVYLADDPRLRRQVALKIPFPNAVFSQDLRDRFLREAQAAAMLTHPNITIVHETGEIAPILFIVAEYCPDGTLADYIRAQSGALPIRLAAGIVLAVARAIEHAHARGVLHRDLKPSNILLGPLSSKSGETTDGLPFTLKVSDFGLAKLANDLNNETKTGSLLGTVNYMSPEQAAGKTKWIGPSTDVYAMGTLLYELIAGRVPFVGETDLDVLRQIETTEPPRLSRLRPETPRDVEAICMKCLEKEPARRYTTAAGLADDLDRFLRHQPILARPAGVWERTTKWIRRKPLVASLIALTALVGIALPAGLTYHTFQMGWALQDAERERINAQNYRAEAETRAYAVDMRLGMELLRQGNHKALVNILCRYENATDRSFTSAFEWRYLSQFQDVMPTWTHLHPGRCPNFLALNDDGRLGLSSSNSKLKCWESQTGRVLWEADVDDRAVAASADGNTVCARSSTDSTTLLMLDGRTGRTMRSIKTPAVVDQLVTSISGRLVATETGGEGITIWDSTTGRPTRKLTTHLQGRPQQMVFSCDDRQLAVLCWRGAEKWLYVWRLSDGVQQWKRELPGPLDWIEYSEDSRLILDKGDGVIKQYSAVDGAPIEGFQFECESKIIARNGNLLIVGTPVGGIAVFDIPSGSSSRFHWQSHPFYKLAIARSASIVAAATAGGAIHLIDVAWPKFCEKLTKPKVSVFAVSPDESELAFSDIDGRIRIISLSSLKVRDLPSVHSSAISSLAYSPDGRSLCSASLDGHVVIWRNGIVLQTLWCKPNRKAITAIFTPDSVHLMVAAQGREQIDLWNLASECRSELTFCPSDKLMLTPNGRFLVVLQDGDHHRNIRAYDLKTAKLSWTINNQHPFSGFAISTDNRFIATADTGGHIALWSGEDGRYFRDLQELTVPCIPATSLRFMHDNRRLAVSHRLSVDIIELESGRRHESYPFPVRANDPKIAVYDREQKLIILDGNGGLIDLDRRAGQIRQLGGSIAGTIESLSFSADSRSLIAGIDMPRRQVRFSQPAPFSKVGSPVFHFDRAFHGRLNDGVRCWDLESRKEYQILPDRSCIAPPRFVAWSPTGSNIVTSGTDGRIQFWTGPMGELIADGFISDRAKEYASRAVLLSQGMGKPEFDRDGETPVALRWSKDGLRLMSAGRCGTVRIWNPSTGELLHSISVKEILAVDLSSDGRYAAIVDSQFVRVFDVETGEMTYETDGNGRDPPTAVLFLPKLERIVVGKRNGELSIQSFKSGGTITTLSGHLGRIVSLAVTTDGKTLASSGSSDGAVRLWNVETGLEIVNMGILRGDIGKRPLLTFSPDGQNLAVGDETGNVFLFRAPEVNTVKPSADGNVSNDR